MPRQADLFERAAKCELAGRSAANAEQYLTIQQLRDLWTNLANDAPFMSPERLAKEIAAIEEMHSVVFGLEENKAAK